MDYFLQQLLNGLTLGMIYGLIAVGYTIVYGIIGMINVAHGDVFMVGAFMAMISLVLLSVLGVTSVPLALAVTFIVAVAFTALYGWVANWVLWWLPSLWSVASSCFGSFRTTAFSSSVSHSSF